MAWVATATFDDIATGDLNGKGGGSGWSANWSGDVDFDVENTVAYQGSQAVEMISTGAGAITRTLTTNVTAGTMYIAMRASNTNSAAMISVLQEGATPRMFVRFDSGNIAIFDNGVYTNIGTFVANTWYVIGIDFDNVAQPNKFRANIDGGTFSSYVTVDGGSYTNITTVRLEADGGGAATRYWDYITPTGPTPPATTTNNLMLLNVG